MHCFYYQQKIGLLFMKQIVTFLLLACSVASQAQITRFSGKSALEEDTNGLQCAVYFLPSKERQAG